MIRLDNTSKQNGHQLLFIDASMGVMKGEKVGLVGPNGAGKSTLFRILLGFLPQTSGEARILGRDSQRLTPQDIGAVSTWLSAQPVSGTAKTDVARTTLPMPCGGAQP